MRKKLGLLVVIIMCFGLLLSGCGSKVTVDVKSPEELARMEGDPLKNLAIKEGMWLASMEKVQKEMDQSFVAWDQGQGTREQFIEQLKKSDRAVQRMIDEYDLHMRVNPFPQTAQNDDIYAKGLVYGDKIRTNVNNFIYKAVEGIMDGTTNTVKPLSDEELKKLYKKTMQEKYPEHVKKLQEAIEKADK